MARMERKVCFRMDERIYRALEKYARDHGKTVSSAIRAAILVLLWHEGYLLDMIKEGLGKREPEEDLLA